MTFKQITNIKDTDFKKAIDTAVKSYSDYEYFNIYFPDKELRIKFLNSLLNVEFKISLKKSEIWILKENDVAVSVSILCAPYYKRPSNPVYIKNGFLKTFFIEGISKVSTVNSWVRMNDKAAFPCHSVKDAWYLNLLTVHPDFQGKGIGRDTINTYIIPRIKKTNGKKIVLFTNTENNRLFYKRIGFTEFDERFSEFKGNKFGSWSYIKNIQ